MKVSTQKIRTPDEEYEYLNKQLEESGNFFSWEEHPNKMRAYDIRVARIKKRLSELIASKEFKEYNPWYSNNK